MARSLVEAVREWHSRGWHPLPLPAGRKKTPPTGWTGHQAPPVTLGNLSRWEARWDAGGNAALRFPDGLPCACGNSDAWVLGVDVDAYEGKSGDRNLADWEALQGVSRPPAPRITSREPDGRPEGYAAGIYLYRVCSARWPHSECPGIVVEDVETIRPCHRYAVAPGSRHPNGNTYEAIIPDIGPVDPEELPHPATLPQLPDAWMEALHGPETAPEPPPAAVPEGDGTPAPDPDVEALIASFTDPPRLSDDIEADYDQAEVSAAVLRARKGLPSLPDALADWLRANPIDRVIPGLQPLRDTGDPRWKRAWHWTGQTGKGKGMAANADGRAMIFSGTLAARLGVEAHSGPGTATYDALDLAIAWTTGSLPSGEEARLEARTQRLIADGYFTPASAAPPPSGGKRSRATGPGSDRDGMGWDGGWPEPILVSGPGEDHPDGEDSDPDGDGDGEDRRPEGRYYLGDRFGYGTELLCQRGDSHYVIEAGWKPTRPPRPPTGFPYADQPGEYERYLTFYKRMARIASDGYQLVPAGTALEWANRQPPSWSVTDRGLALDLGAPGTPERTAPDGTLIEAVPGDTCLLYGPQNAGKSWVALYILAALKVPALYLATEQPRGIADRLASRPDIFDQIHLATAAPSGPDIVRLADHLDEHAVKVVVVDCLSPLLVDENSAPDYHAVMAMLSPILAGRLAILVHHEGKSEAAGPRGTSRIIQAPTLGYRITADAERGPGWSRIDPAKVKDPRAGRGGLLEIRWHSHPGRGPDIIPHPHPSAAADSTLPEWAALRERWEPVFGWPPTGRSRRKIVEDILIPATGTSRNRADRIFGRLLDRLTLERVGSNPNARGDLYALAPHPPPEDPTTGDSGEGPDGDGADAW